MNLKRVTPIAAIVLFCVFCIFVIFYERHERRTALSDIETHARVIANALWNLNPQGASEYLSLACESQNYENIVVTDTNGKIFQEAVRNAPNWQEKLFVTLHLISSVQLTSIVAYEGKTIGEIKAIWNCNSIYLELFVLFALVLIFFIIQLNARLFHTKQILEDRVLKRTSELSRLNNDLLLEAEEHRQAREALFKSEERYRLMADNIADVLWVTDMNLKCTYISPSIYQLVGYTSKEAMKQSLAAMITPASYERVMSLFSKKLNLIKSGDPEGWEPALFEIEQNCKDGSTIWTSHNARFLKGLDDQPEGVLGVTRDISAQKLAEIKKIRAERHALEQEKLALVGQIAGKIAHDFNNILGAVMGNAELAMLDCPDDQTRKKLELIFNQTIRGKNLTKNLVAFARDQEPRQEFFEIDKKMELVLNLMKKDLETIHVIKEYGQGIPEVLADPGMIEHAIVNLVQNSIHAVSLVERPEIMIRTYYRDEFIFFEIEDNGCGIPLEFIEKIFEPSFTLKGSKDKDGMYKPGIKGTGYGMSNVKKYIEQHKGFISIRSELKKGTKITISLPEIKKELTVKEIEEIKKDAVCVEKYILLVEDEQSISDVQYRILTHEPCNHKVDIADHGKAAIDLLSRNEYDLISLDYVLPGGFNGMDVYHHVRETNKSIPILFISGNIEFLESIKELKQKDPSVDHLSKPCMNIDYLNCINKLLGQLS